MLESKSTSSTIKKYQAIKKYQKHPSTSITNKMV